jgi:hypothetical protein
MKSSSIALALLLTLAFYGCKERTAEKKELESNRKPAATLTASVLTCNYDTYGSHLLHYKNDTLVMRDFARSEYLAEYVLEADSLRLIGSFARKGEGPLDINGFLVNLFRDAAGKKYVYSTLYGLQCFQTGEHTDLKTWRRINFPQQKGASWGEMAPFKEGLFLVIGGDVNAPTLFSMIDLKKQSIVPIAGALYPDDKVETTPYMKKTIYTNSGGLLKRPGSTNEYLYFCHQFGNYAEIIQLNDSLQLTRNAFLTAYPKYEDRGELRMQISKEDLRGLGAGVTREHIYILPTYKNLETDKPKKEGYPTGYNDELFLFDWNGTFVASYQLDRPVTRYFVVDEQRRCILAKTIDPATDEELILSYPLPGEE